MREGRSSAGAQPCRATTQTVRSGRNCIADSLAHSVPLEMSVGPNSAVGQRRDAGKGAAPIENTGALGTHRGRFLRSYK